MHNNEIRFGAIVTLRTNNQKLKFQILGVDEADVRQQKIVFVSPIARAITGAKVGDKLDFKLGSEVRELEIFNITYSQ